MDAVFVIKALIIKSDLYFSLFNMLYAPIFSVKIGQH